MSEARKCDRCKDFYDIAEEQQDKAAPYEFKGDYINLHLWVARNGIRKDKMSQWYDLCPKCMNELEHWLKNNEFPTICDPEEVDVERSFIEDVSNVEDILPDKIIPDEPYNSVEDLEDPCDSCLFVNTQKNCEQCQYGYIEVDARKKKYAKRRKSK